MDVVAPVGADEQSAAVVEPGERALDDPAVAAEAGTVFDLAASDQRLHATLPDEPAVLIVVVAAVGNQRRRATAWPADFSAHWRHSVEELKQLRDVVAVAARERPGKRDPAGVYEEMVLAATATAIDGTGTRLGAPFFACR